MDRPKPPKSPSKLSPLENSVSPMKSDKKSLKNQPQISPFVSAKSPESAASSPQNIAQASTPNTWHQNVNELVKSVDTATFTSRCDDIKLSEEEEDLYTYTKEKYEHGHKGSLCDKCNIPYYDKLFPCVVSCGHSYCIECYNNLKEIHCSKCKKTNKITRSQKEIINKDLLINSVVWQKSHKLISARLMRNLERNIKMFEFPCYMYGDSIASTLSNLSFLLHLNYLCCNDIEETYNNKLNILQKILSDVLKTATSLKDLSERMYALESFEKFPNKIEAMGKEIIKFKEFMSVSDDALIGILSYIEINDELIFGARIGEVFFQNEILLALSHTLTVLGIYKTLNWTKYSQFFIYQTRLCSYSLERSSRCSENNHIFVIDFQSVRRSIPIYGVIFYLKFTDGSIRHLRLEIEDESLFGEQIYILCIGERGPCFKGGRGIVTDKKIIIKSYLDDGEVCSSDIHFKIPDEVGQSRALSKGIVSAARKYGSEIELVISKAPEKSHEKWISNCIGTAEGDSYLDFPTGEFVIESCGVMYMMQLNLQNFCPEIKV